VLPGFRLTLGFTLTYLSVVILLPLAALGIKGAATGPRSLWAAVSDARVAAAFRLSFGASFAAAALNGVFGVVVAWVLVRYRFPGRRVVDAMVDLPFALPTAVAGIALTTLYAPGGWLGRPLSALGLPVSYTRAGIVVALTFVGLPFVVRTLQPVILGLPATGYTPGESGDDVATGYLRLRKPFTTPQLARALSLGGLCRRIRFRA